MLPAPLTRPSYLPLRCVVVGAAMAMIWLWMKDVPCAEGFRLLAGAAPVGRNGGTFASELLPLGARTLSLVGGAMVLSAAFGIMIAFAASKISVHLLSVVTLLGHALGALPVVGVAWWCIGWVVNEAQLPVESLLPYTPPQDRDDPAMMLGRQLWAWLVPVWVMVIPLVGWWMIAAVDALRVPGAMAWPWPRRCGAISRDARRVAWWQLRDRWLALMPLALVFDTVVEDAFGLRGVGAMMASSARSGDQMGVAAALYASGWITAAWCVVSVWWTRSSRSETLVLRGAMDACGQESERHAHGVTIAWLWLLLAAIVVSLAVGAGDERTAWVGKVVLPWCEPLLPVGWSPPLVTLLPGLWDDVRASGIVVLGALVLALIGGALAAMISRAFRWPQVQCLDALCWWPCALAGVAAAAQGNHHWLAAALSLGGMQLVRDEVIKQRRSGCAQGAKVLGGPVMARWCRHVLPPVVQRLAAWLLQSLGTAMLLIVLAHALQASSAVPSLGNALAAAKGNALIDPSGVVRPTLLAALAVLCCWQLGRLARLPS